MIHFLLKLSCQRHNEDDNLILMSTMTVYTVFCIRSFSVKQEEAGCKINGNL